MNPTMENAFANAKEVGIKESATKPTGRGTPVVGEVPRLSNADVHARRMARQENRGAAAVVIGESVITDYVEINEEQRGYERKLEPLKAKGSAMIPVEQVNMARADLEAKVRACEEELTALTAENPFIITAVAQREALRASARSDIQAFKQLDPANYDEEAVRKMLGNAVLTGTLKVSGGDYVAAVEDSVLQQLEGRVEDFFVAIKVLREEKNQERADRVKAYLLSDRKPKDGGESPLEAEKRKSGRVSFTRLRSGEGHRAFVPVFGKNKNEAGDRTGAEYFMGEVFVERQDGKPTVTKASRVGLAERVFYSYDRTKNGHRERGSVVVPSDLDKIQPIFLRESLQRQLVKDTESADRRDKANALATVENYPDAQTFNDFCFGGKPGRWIDNSEWIPEGRQRPSHVTYHLVSDGKQFQIGEAACDLKEIDEDFFGKYMVPTPLSTLSTDKRWLAKAANNREFERDWELRRAASKYPEVTFITKENLGNVFGLNGVDGMYAGGFRWDQTRNLKDRTDAPKWAYGGCIVERRGEKIHYSYTSPGVAENLLAEEQNAYPVADLPKWTRTVSKGMWTAVTRNGETVPNHLNSATKKPKSAE